MTTSNESPEFEGKRLTPRAAIRKNCRRCNGGDNPKSCPVRTCPLYPFRLSEVTDASTTPLKAIRGCCLDCVGSAEEVRTCPAYKPFSDQPACALWPHRFGKRYVTEKYREARRAQANKQHREPGTGAAFKAQDEAEK